MQASFPRHLRPGDGFTMRRSRYIHGQCQVLRLLPASLLETGWCTYHPTELFIFVFQSLTETVPVYLLVLCEELIIQLECYSKSLLLKLSNVEV